MTSKRIAAMLLLLASSCAFAQTKIKFSTRVQATSADLIALWSGSCSVSTFLRGDGACAVVSSASINAAGPVLNATNSAYGCVADDSTSNDTCWANLQTAANAATEPATIYFPYGANAYKWSNSPSFTKPVSIVCEPGAVFDYAGSGNEITFGDIGAANGLVYDFQPYKVIGCGHIGGASATYGIYGGLNHWHIVIEYNWWKDWGSTTNYAIYCKGNNFCLVQHNKYWQDTGAATNWLYAPDAGTAGWGSATVRDNYLNCVASSGAPSQGACGIGMWVATTTGTDISDNPFISAFATGIRLDPASSAISVMVDNNYIEENPNSVGIQLGNPASSNQVIDSVIAKGNRFYLASGGSGTVIAPANATAKITNSQFVNNFLRSGGAAVPLVTENNLSGQAGNCAEGNVNFAGSHTTVANGELWTDCNSKIGINTSRTSNSTSGGSSSGFLVHTATAGGAYGWQSDDGAADAKTWDLIQATGSNNICFRAVNDANSSANNVWCAVRSGASVTGITFSTPVTLPTLLTSTNCAAVGTSANPSVASCSAAPAGSVSCATNASTGTCTVNTTAVTANSEIFIQQRTDTTTGTRLGVTCNTTKDSNSTAPQITAVTAATSFTFQLGTITTNPECFSYRIIN
jgi:hypothetical protein